MPRPSTLRVFALKLLAVLFLLFILTHIPWPFGRPAAYHNGAYKPNSASDSPTTLPNLQFHGQGPCLPPSASRTALLNKAASIRESCRASSPFSALLPAANDQSRRPRVATLTAQWGDPKGYYQKAIQTHLVHALVHETDLHLLCAPTIQAPKGAPDTLANRLEIYWNKPTLVLSVLLSEMAKPKSERLDWLLWADADTIILDHCRPITTFLPPETNTDDDTDEHDEEENDGLPHLLYTNDMLGLNNGVFLIRVSSWSVNLMTAVLGFRFLRPTVELDYLDQTAMEILIAEDPRFRARALEVPQTWFNAYAHPSGASSARAYAGDSRDGAQQGPKLRDYHARRGDFLAHFPGDPEREASMNAWLDEVDRLGNVWESNRVQRDVSGDVELFWNRWARRRSDTKAAVA
ncbi:glycosyltransferase family 34 protein [Sodiomyces alcalophilus JCM 7366]|uniref:glycosyltransferase family 34 protein n=1 Tax=Sodiomyces alcalophilus JCM 7366 TaxID=591952 RepID=UPI0039B52BE6